MQNDQKWPIWGLKLQCSKTKERQCVIGLHRLYNYLKYVFFQNYLQKEKDLNGKAAKRFDLHKTRQVQFEASFMGDFKRTQNLPLAIPRVCCMEIQVLEVSFPS